VDRKRNLLGALGLALVGTFLLVGYVRAAGNRAGADERLVPVLVTTSDVAQGTSVKDLLAHVAVRQVPASARTHGAASDIADIDGRVPATNLFAGEQVLESRLTKPEEASTELPAGTVAVTLSLEAERANGGRLLPGGTVDVLVSYDDPDRTETVLQDARVQAVSKPSPSGVLGRTSEITKIATGGSESFLVTLVVPEERAEALVFAADHGRMWLAGEQADRGVTTVAVNG
jgi:pilus assembly protein CpaB